MIDKTKLDEKTTKMLLREIKVMDACNHPNLVRLYEVLENKEKLATSTGIYFTINNLFSGNFYVDINN